jgi:hypothetical protein
MKIDRRITRTYHTVALTLSSHMERRIVLRSSLLRRELCALLCFALECLIKYVFFE